MKNAKDVLLDHCWEIHKLHEAEDKALDEGKDIDVTIALSTAVDMFCNNLDDVGRKDDQYKYDGVERDWQAIAEAYGWADLTANEKNDIKAKYMAAGALHGKEIQAAYKAGNEKLLRELYRDGYAKLG